MTALTPAAVTILSVEKVAKRFDVSPITVRRWIAEGRIRGSRIGRRWYFTEQDVADALTRARQPEAAAS